MSKDENDHNLSGIPQQIIESFLKQLETDKISADVVARLRETLLEEGDLSEAAVKLALSSENKT